MPGKRRMAALAIGVGDARPLQPLPAAVNAARGFYEWAQANGYEARLVTDEDEPLTLVQLRQELLATLQIKPSGVPIHRLLLFFAGHGFIREAEEGLWLLSDWSRELRAVAVEPLKRRLYRYGIQQIGIIADACRSLSDKLDIVDLTPDAVLGRGPVENLVAPEIDRFAAAQDGEEAYAIPGDLPEEDRCLFSGLLLEGLWGKKKTAFSKILPNKVTSSSLGTYLKQEVPLLAQRYQLKLNPTVSYNFPDDDNVYFGDRPPLRPPPTFPEWRDPDSVLKGTGANALGNSGTAVTGRRLTHPTGIPEMEGAEKSRLDQARRRVDSLRTRLEAKRVVPRSRLPVGGFAVESNVAVRAVWSPPLLPAQWRGPTMWQVAEADEQAPTLVEFDDGIFAAFAVMPQFFASIVRDAQGVSALVYSPRYGNRYWTVPSERALAEMEGGALRSDQVLDLAVNLREGKHIDPMLGVISAYLYDSIGDADNIRRMACFYVEHYQPIPYDIALLADLRCETRNGVLWAFVPAVAARKARTKAEERYSWTHEGTRATQGAVGGFWPWLRQGWAFLDDPTDHESTLILPRLTDLTSFLVPSRVTTFDQAGGLRLASLFGLVPTWEG